MVHRLSDDSGDESAVLGVPVESWRVDSLRVDLISHILHIQQQDSDVLVHGIRVQLVRNSPCALVHCIRGACQGRSAQKSSGRRRAVVVTITTPTSTHTVGI